MAAAPSFLARMIEDRRARIAAVFGQLDRSVLEHLAGEGRPPRDIGSALRAGEEVAIIAEVKKASPSAGPIAPGVDAAEQVRCYAAGGAAAVSVLTEPSVFGGSFEDLAAASAAVDVPVLCKDFVVDEAQVLVARGCGADAILLMVSVLGEDVERYLSLARRLGMQALVEVASHDELGVALRSSADLVGVNSRDLHSLAVDREAALALVNEAAALHVTTVLASGVRGAEDVLAAARAGADAVLVGESLMRAGSPADAVRELAAVGRGAVGS